MWTQERSNDGVLLHDLFTAIEPFLGAAERTATAPASRVTVRLAEGDPLVVLIRHERETGATREFACAGVGPTGAALAQAAGAVIVAGLDRVSEGVRAALAHRSADTRLVLDVDPDLGTVTARIVGDGGEVDAFMVMAGDAA